MLHHAMCTLARTEVYWTNVTGVDTSGLFMQHRSSISIIAVPLPHVIFPHLWFTSLPDFMYHRTIISQESTIYIVRKWFGLMAFTLWCCEQLSNALPSWFISSQFNLNRLESTFLTWKYYSYTDPIVSLLVLCYKILDKLTPNLCWLRSRGW